MHVAFREREWCYVAVTYQQSPDTGCLGLEPFDVMMDIHKSVRITHLVWAILQVRELALSGVKVYIISNR